MEGCRNNFVELLLRIGAGCIVLGVIIFIMSFFGPAPQTAEEVTGSTVNIYEMIFLFVTLVAGTPLSAAVFLLAGGLIMVIIALFITSGDKKEPHTSKRQQRSQ